MVRPKRRPAQPLYGSAIWGGIAPHAEMPVWPRETTLAVYRMSKATFVAMYEEQGKRCAICKVKPEHPAGLLIDHNHATGKVRGLLCSGCNTGLGHLKDSPDVLEAAMQYLEERGCYGPNALAEEAS